MSQADNMGNPHPEALEPVACHICGGSPQTIITQGQFGLPAHVAICRGCGLVYLNPRWSRARYQQFYAHEYNQYFRIITAPDIYTKRVSTIVQCINQATSRREFATILDVGSGDGFTLDALKGQYQATTLLSIESSQTEQNMLRQKGYHLIAEDVDSDWHLAYANSVDLVIMRHVIEHFLDPVGVLQKVASVLKPDGLLYLATPDMMNPRGDLTRYWFRVVHTYYFSEITLRRTFMQAQLELAAPVMHESSEMICILRRAERPYSGQLPSVYAPQMAVIRRAQLKTPFIRANQVAYRGWLSIRRALSWLKRLFIKR
jgi:SAM-dependent methyltransferase